MTVRFAPGDFARQEWSEPAKAPAGKVYGHGKGYFEYRIELPPSVVKAHPESFYYLFQAGPRPSASGSTGPSGSTGRTIPRPTRREPGPRRWPCSFNGRPIERITLPDDAADARGVLSHLAGVEHGSHGELVDGMVMLTDSDRAAWPPASRWSFAWPSPMTRRSAGGLCIFGATTGELPLDPTLEIHTRDPLPADLGVDPNRSLAVAGRAVDRDVPHHVDSS